jgi:hypothetical protein
VSGNSAPDKKNVGIIKPKLDPDDFDARHLRGPARRNEQRAEDRYRGRLAGAVRA